MSILNLIRIYVITYKLIILVILMNINDTADLLIINSLALIFILDLDAIIYAWCYDKKNDLEFECIKFSQTFVDVKVIFNIKF